jgi:hypothetical protein
MDDVWNKAVHVLPRFRIPKSWYVDRSFDWGSSHPFCVGWWAEANGEEAEMLECVHCGYKVEFHQKKDHDFEAKKFCPAKGSLIKLNEWYGTQGIGTNKGLRLSATMIALGIREREIAMLKEHWLARQPWPGPADNQIRDVREDDVDTIEKKMADKGVRWQTSDKSAGSRKNGLELMRERLLASMLRAGMKFDFLDLDACEISAEDPGIYFMENCLGTITTLPALPRDEENLDDVDSESEDHPYDETRYRVLKSANRAARKINVKWPT